MPIHTCQCGARYRFAEQSAGKRAKCKQCGDIFSLGVAALDPIPIAPDPVLDGGPPDALSTSPDVTPAPPPGWSPGSVIIERAETPPAPPTTYAADILALPLFLARLDNLLTFTFMWLILAISAVAPLVVGLIILAFYAIFRFGVITEAASGTRRLPELTPSSDVWAELVGGLIKWVGSWFVVMVPALCTLSIAAWAGKPITGGVLRLLSVGLVEFFKSGMTQFEAAFVVTACLGIFLWPMVVLCIAIGGFSALTRLDLIIASVVRTLPIYGFTVGLVFLAQFTRPLQPSLSGDLVAVLLAIGLGLYLDIIAMRSIGLYYHHFKHRFAWSWE
jgi:hypothetical protein